MSSPSVAIIGAGIGGLTSAALLAARGISVTVYEADRRIGGKLGYGEYEGVRFDTGPSVVTMTNVFEAVFREAGERLEDHVTLTAPERNFLYQRPTEDVALPIAHQFEQSLQNVREHLGEDAAREFREFVDYSERIWTAAAPYFIFGKAPSPKRILRFGLKGLNAVRRIDPSRTMWEGIASRVKNRTLQDLFARYATYNGSNVFEAPATLNCIAYVELALGGYGVKGGLFELAEAIAALATERGATIELNSPVRGLELGAGSRVEGVRTDAGTHRFDAVICNADVSHLVHALLPDSAPAPRVDRLVPSTSGWTAVIKAKRRPGRYAHTVLFPERYHDEFRDMFGADRPPNDPTVYICNQSVAHERESWEGCETLFVMANAPAEPGEEPSDEGIWTQLRSRVMRRLLAEDLVDADDEIVWQRTPAQLAELYPNTRGAIYGAASNDRWSAFRRPPNRTKKIPGLYLASGSAHPGGGIPLCALSGWQAVNQLFHDLGMEALPEIGVPVAERS